MRRAPQQQAPRGFQSRRTSGEPRHPSILALPEAEGEMIRSRAMSVVQIDATESQPHVKYERLVAAAKLVPSAVTIVAHPCDEASLRGAAKPPPALAFDNAIDKEAARIKGIKSAVAGAAPNPLVPHPQAANKLAKDLTFMANTHTA